MRTLLKTLWLLWLSAVLTAYAGNDIRWTEEVKLSDGRIIQVQRRTELTESGFPVQKRGLYKYHEICYPPMGINWKSKGGYLPDIFDIVDGKAYMHVPISDCFTCEHYGYPTSNALYFVWESGGWKRISHEQFPKSSEWNLLMSVKAAPGHENDDPRGVLTITDKDQRQSSARYEQKRLGWKRVSDSLSMKGRCDSCRGVRNIIYDNDKDFLEVLVSDTKPSCQ